MVRCCMLHASMDNSKEMSNMVMSAIQRASPISDCNSAALRF